MEDSKRTTKPLWLEALEKQSWQAELIASGLAIYGSLSLGPLIDNAVTLVSTLFSDRVLEVMVFVFIYMYLIHIVVVVAFIAHLILRIIWAGFIGLSSVYPDGINIENKTYARHFLEDAKSEFPDLSEYSIYLDNICSRVFSNLCVIIIVFLCLAIWILIIIGVSEGIYYLFGVNIIKPLILTIGAVFMLFGLVTSLFTVGPKKDSSFAKKYIYKINQGASKVMLFNFYRPANYIIWTQRTNQSTKQFIFGFLILFPITFIGGIKVSDVIGRLESDSFFQLNALPYDASSANYLDENDDQRIIRPIIQSKIIKENYIELFIPQLTREKASKIKMCGESNVERDKRILQNRIDQASYEEKCASKYYKVAIDSIEFDHLTFKYVKHSLNKERGYQMFIPINQFGIGRHNLKIKTGYQNEDGEYAHRVIPFYKVK